MTHTELIAELMRGRSRPELHDPQVLLLCRFVEELQEQIVSTRGASRASKIRFAWRQAQRRTSHKA